MIPSVELLTAMIKHDFSVDADNDIQGVRCLEEKRHQDQ